MSHKFPYEWRLADGYPAKGIEKNGLKVFSCFSCGGGSTMGYKLAGYDVIGCNEIDPRMMEVYKANHNPKYSFLEGIQTFKDREDLPEELYNLDILDGSPPCSSFSSVGNREKDWGKEKKFREGQSEQVLDTLFFDFIELAEKLQPRVSIAENVKGLLLGNAIEYVKKIYKAFDKAGYYVQHFLVNGADMGLPQRRERVFFVCIRKDLATPFLEQVDFFTHLPAINLFFNEKHIPFKHIQEQTNSFGLSDNFQEIWNAKEYGDKDFGDTLLRLRGSESHFSHNYLYPDKVANTQTAARKNILFDEMRFISDNEIIKISSFPLDYDFKSTQPAYLCGMSVPPVMTAQIASRIYEQWLSKIPQQSELKKAS
jgi:DNA (cytosine-5)-methyltransferase 1